MIKKKFITMLVALFTFPCVADMHSQKGGVDHLSDMVQSSSSSSSSYRHKHKKVPFNGAFELKYTAHGVSQSGDVEKNPYPSFRLRLGKHGKINEVLKWKAVTSSDLEVLFNTSPKLRDLMHLEQAYVAYTPVEGFAVKVGKYGWHPKFHKTGVLYDDDIYTAGLLAKYYYGDNKGKFYAKAMVYNLQSNTSDGDESGTELANTETAATNSLPDGAVVKAKVGGKYAVADVIKAGVSVSTEYGGFDDNTNSKWLAQVGVKAKTTNTAIPVGAFGAYTTDVQNPSASHSWTAGAYVGSAVCNRSGKSQDFSVALSYYDLQASDFNVAFADTDYISNQGNSKGFAGRVQYNIVDSTNLVVKYALDMTDSEQTNHNFVGELTFNF